MIYSNYVYFGLYKACKIFNTNINCALSTLAYKCMNNEILMYCRKLERHKKLNPISLDTIIDDTNRVITLNDIVAEDENIEDLIIEKYNYQEIIYALKFLSEKDKEILYLYSEGKTQKQIAEIYKVKQPTISRRLKRVYIKIANNKKELDTQKEAI